MPQEDIPFCSYTFHPKEEGWGNTPDLTLEVEFSADEMGKLSEMRASSEKITHALPWLRGSGIHREFVVSGALGVPWAYSLQNREYALGVLAGSVAKIEEYGNRYFHDPDRADTLSKFGFTPEVLSDIEELRADMMSFLPPEPELEEKPAS